MLHALHAIDPCWRARPDAFLSALLREGACVLSCLQMQNREEAQRAKDDLNGIMLHDNELRIGWGKAIPIPSAPMFVLNPPGGVAPARGATIAPPGALAAALGPWGVPGAHDPNIPTGQPTAS